MRNVIVVGVDGSENADAALRWAMDLAGRTDATLRVVSACGWSNVVGVPGARFPTESREEAEARAYQVIDDALTRVGDAALPVAIERHVAQVPAQDVLLEAAREADLLVVGCRGLGGIRGLLIGSVSQHVVTHAPCPVVVVPDPQRARDQEVA